MIHFYYGENDFALRRQVNAVTEKFAAKYGAENISRIDAAEIDPQQLIAEIVNINLFAPNRLIVLSGLAKNKTILDALSGNLNRVPDTTELVIIDPKPDKRTKIFKSIEKNAKSREFSPLKNYEIEKFVIDEAANQKVEIKRDAVSELVAYTGGDQWRIASEIAKFRALDKVITIESVREIVEPDLAVNVFQLLDDVFNKRRDAAKAGLDRARQTEDANKFLGLLASQVYALAATVNAGGQSPNQIAADIGAHPFVVSKMQSIARHMTAQDVARISQIVAETDAKMKSTGADPWVLIELALAKMMQ